MCWSVYQFRQKCFSSLSSFTSQMINIGRFGQICFSGSLKFTFKFFVIIGWNKITWHFIWVIRFRWTQRKFFEIVTFIGSKLRCISHTVWVICFSWAMFEPFLSADALSAELDAPKEALKSFANDESDESDIVAPKSANQSDSSSSFLFEVWNIYK